MTAVLLLLTISPLRSTDGNGSLTSVKNIATAHSQDLYDSEVTGIFYIPSRRSTTTLLYDTNKLCFSNQSINSLTRSRVRVLFPSANLDKSICKRSPMGVRGSPLFASPASLWLWCASRWQQWISPALAVFARMFGFAAIIRNYTWPDLSRKEFSLLHFHTFWISALPFCSLALVLTLPASKAAIIFVSITDPENSWFLFKLYSRLQWNLILL